jgi:DNA polymerase I-like protein with 3'-5' exonuclease and polymerase domains
VRVKVRRSATTPPLFRHFTSNLICFDTEGTGLIPYGPPTYWGYHPARPFAFAFCDGDGNTAYFRWKVDPATRRVIPGPDHEQQILRRLVTDPAFTIVGHNIAYDLRMAEALGFPVQHHNVHDTMVLAHVVTAGDELSYALKPLSVKYLNFPDEDEKQLEHEVATARREAKARGWLIAGGKKDVEHGEHVVFAGNKPIKADYWLVPSPHLDVPLRHQNVDLDHVDMVQRYAVGDVIRAMLLFQLWEPELAAEPRLAATYRREMQLFWVLRKMEKRGTRVYPEHTHRLIDWYQRYMKKMEILAAQHGGEGMNFMSPKQLCDKFYSEKGYAPMYTEKGQMKLAMGDPTAERHRTLGKDRLAELGATDEDTGEYKDPLAKAILEWRAAKQSIKSFLNIYAKFWYPETHPSLENGNTAAGVSHVHHASDAGWYGHPGAVWVLHPNYNQTGAVTGRMTCCIAQDTPIEIARDLSQHPQGIPVQDVRPGDWAYCVDERTGELHLRQVKKVWDRGVAHALVRVHWVTSHKNGHRKGYVDVTPEHRLRTVDGQWIQAKDLTPRDRLTAFHRDHRVVRVETLNVMRPVYDLWIDEHHNFFAGELVCANSDPNLQQVASATTGLRKAEIPARPRECFGPRPGCLWYLPDYSQIEVWLFAFMSGEANMQQLLLSGYDFHQGVADKSFTRKPDYEARKKYYRKLAKLIMFGKLYGGGVGTAERPGRMTKLLQMPFEQAKEFIDSFEEQFRSVAAYTKMLTNRAKRDKEAWNVYGRKYTLDTEWAYKVVNYMIQGTAADLLKVATMRIDWMLERRWPHPQLGLLNTVHDELIIEVPYSLHSMALMRDIVWVMQMDSDLVGVPVPLPVGMKVATKRWSHTKDIELPPWVRGGVPRDAGPYDALQRDMQACPYKSTVDEGVVVHAS